MVIPLKNNVDAPLFVTLTDLATLVVFIARSPKAKLLGDTLYAAFDSAPLFP